MNATQQPEVVVIGAGVVGLAAARRLAIDGLRVEILEADEAGAKTSLAAAGMLAPLSPHLGDGLLIEMGIEALALWEDFATELVEETSIDIDYDTSGGLVPALRSEDLPHLDSYARVAEQCGLSVRHLDAPTLRRVLPAIHEDVAAGLYLERESRVSSVLLIEALRASCELLEIPIHRQRPVSEIDPDAAGVTIRGPGWELRVDRALLCAGAGAARVRLPTACPIKPIRGQMISYDEIDWPFRGSIHTPDFYAVRRHGSELIVGTTVEDVGFDDTVTIEARDQLLERSGRLFPELRQRGASKHWAGLRPGTPDELPILGFFDTSPLALACGHFRNGILLAPLTAAMVSDLFAGDSSNHQRFLARLGLDRFGADAET